MASRQWVVRSGQDLGRTIADVRHLRGLSQAQLAESSGVERTYLAKLEAGASALLLERAVRILRRLGATLMVQIDDAAGESDGAPS